MWYPECFLCATFHHRWSDGWQSLHSAVSLWLPVWELRPWMAGMVSWVLSGLKPGSISCHLEEKALSRSDKQLESWGKAQAWISAHLPGSLLGVSETCFSQAWWLRPRIPALGAWSWTSISVSSRPAWSNGETVSLKKIKTKQNKKLKRKGT